MLQENIKQSSRSNSVANWHSFHHCFSHVVKEFGASSCSEFQEILGNQINVPQSGIDEEIPPKTKAVNLQTEKDYESDNELDDDDDEDDDEMVPTTDIGTQTSFYLSEVDPMTLQDDVILTNFCDQDERLVCLVCYKIFPSNIEQDLALFKKHLAGHKKTSLKRVKVLQKTSSVSPCYSDDVNQGKFINVGI